MARYRFKMQRLYLNHPLLAGAEIVLDKAQSNYLVNVLRMGEGQRLLVFNGQDGEWQAELATASKKGAALILREKIRNQPPPSTLDYCFAPLKQARLDYMVQKAVEMGAGRLRPVLTDHTQVTRLNSERMVANVIEAAEQCGILSLPAVNEPARLAHLLDQWEENEQGRLMIFCDEGDERDDPLGILRTIRAEKLALLIGPEGGFSEAERQRLKSLSHVVPLPLGPRIMRADTAAVAALAVLQASVGDWR